MAGFRRLCGRFRCAAVRLFRVGQRARNSSVYGVCGALCRWVGRVGERRELRAHAHE